MMAGCLHHVVNEHEWALDGCKHDPLAAEEVSAKNWLRKESDAHVALKKIVLNRQWLKKAGEYYRNFRWTVLYARVNCQQHLQL